MIDRETDIFNSDDSYLGSDIKEWCEYQIKNETSFHYYASALFYDVFYIDNDFKPNPKVYYYAVYERNYRGIPSCYLNRDVEKSPRINKK